jgi:transposase InsO family protein
LLSPLALEDARRLVDRSVRYYDDERLHSASGYVTPKDKLAGCEPMIFAERKRTGIGA